MSVDLRSVEQRLDRIADLYAKLDEMIDQLPISLPSAVRDAIRKALFENQDMTTLVDGIKNRRPPRFVLVGRTGVGKSSLINAMCGQYLAKVSDVAVGTKQAERFSYTSLGKTLFEVIDTRGLAESLAVKVDRSAETELVAALRTFEPDAILFLNRCKERAHLDKDAAILKTIGETFNSKVPIVALLTQADEMEPSREKEGRRYSERKLKNIRDAEIQLRKILADQGVQPLAVFAISAYLEWNRDPATVEPEDHLSLQIQFDGRYRINDLLDLLESNIDIRAGVFFMLVTRLDQVARRISERLTRVFSTGAAAIATTPIPLSDIYILLALQTLLIMLIAFLAGHDMSYETAKNLLISLCGTGMAGVAFRAIAQQAAKLLNLVTPGAGSVTSAAVAAGGTYAIGRGAIRYFFDHVSDEELRQAVKEAREEFDASRV